jgi:hypothetical protein
MARIENHKYSIEEAFRECFYIVPDYQRGDSQINGQRCYFRKSMGN